MSSDLQARGDIGADYRDIIARSSLADSTKIKYERALERFLRSGGNLGDVDYAIEYAASLSESGRQFFKSALTMWTDAIAEKVKAGATPENVDVVTAMIYRIEALQASIKVSAAKGQGAHTWLTAAEVSRLLTGCDNGTVGGLRDRIAIGLMVSAGLRREEAASLRWQDVKEQPVKERFRTILDIEGKGKRQRVIPISDRLAAGLDEWAGKTDRQGFVLRSLRGTHKSVGESLSAPAIYHIVREAGERIGKPDLAPHDLRRTYAQLGYEAGIPVTQISRLLGHSSISTTQRYLNLELDTETTISDFIPF